MTDDLIMLGEIKSIRKDRKGIQLTNEQWFNSFNVLDSFEKGDIVKIKYKVKGDFKNIVSIEKEKFEEVKTKELPKETVNTIIMCAKDIKIAEINKEFNRPFGQIIDEILQGLQNKTIKINL